MSQPVHYDKMKDIEKLGDSSFSRLIAVMHLLYDEMKEIEKLRLRHHAQFLS